MRRLGPGGAVLALVALPYFVSSYVLELVSATLVLGLLAASLNLLMGYGGMPSIAHAAFFGVGGYSAGLGFMHLTSWAPLGMLLGAAAGGALGLVFALVAHRVQGGYLIMLTIALGGLVVSAIGQSRSVTGGSDGLLVPSASLWPTEALLDDLLTIYWFLVASVVIGIALLYAVGRSPFASALVGVRQNPARMAALGYDVRKLRIAAWTIATAIAGYAGSLSVIEAQFISPDAAGLSASALVFLIASMGGREGFAGAVLAALLVVLVRDELSAVFLGRGQLMLGLLFIVIVYAFPGGISWPALVRRLRGVGLGRPEGAQV